MEWPEALDIVVARTKHEHYRQACADGNPHADIWRRRILRMAGEVVAEPAPQPSPSYPPLMQQASNAVHAVGRIASAVIRGNQVLVSKEDRDRRRQICVSCDKYDPVQSRCTQCACFSALKPWLNTEVCPLNKW